MGGTRSQKPKIENIKFDTILKIEEDSKKKKVDANVIADRMMDANLGGHYLLRRYAEEVRALKRVSEYDVDQIVPDHLPGHLIYGLFKESIDEKYIVDNIVITISATAKIVFGDTAASNKKILF